MPNDKHYVDLSGKMRLGWRSMKQVRNDLSSRFPAVGFITVLSLLCLFVLFHNLGGAAFFEPDEGRNAEVAREILLLKDWVTPHYDFIPYLDKPIFLYWLVASSYRLFGISEWSARLPSALAALGCVLLVYDLARTRLGVWGALWSSLVLLTSTEFFAFSRLVIFDMTLTFFITLSLWAFYRGSYGDQKARRGFFLLMYAAMGLGTLVKGPIGLILPGMVICVYLLLGRRWSILREINLVPGFMIFMLIVIPWYALAELRNPGYLRYFLFEEHILRYLTPHFHRSQPWYYYFEVMLVGFLPWTVLIPSVVRGLRREPRDDACLFLLSWAVLPFLFFSLSSSKLPGYILPIFPPVSILTGLVVIRILNDPSERERWVLSIPWLTLILVHFYFVLALFWPGVLPRELQRYSLQISALIRQSFVPMALPFFLLLILATWASLWGEQEHYYFISSAVLFLLFLLNGKIIGPISSLLSSKELVEKSAALIRPEDQIVIYDTNRSSLPFYLNVSRPIWIVWSGRKSSIMGSFYMAEKKPQPAAGYGQVLFTFDEFSMASKESPRRLLIFVEEKGFTRLHKQLNALPKRLLKISEVILVTNE